MEERLLICNSVKSLKKYGSTGENNNHHRLCEEYTKHLVKENDTLQGIALKYGVTTEQIRRTNKLWANDNLFIGQTLQIPVEHGTVSTSEISLDYSSESDLFLNQSSDEIQNGFSASNSSRSSVCSQRIEDDLDSYNDFLSRIDADIANKRQRVKITQDRSSFNDHTTDNMKKMPALSRHKQQQQRREQSYVNSDIPHVITQNKKLRSSLQKLQEKQEEIFEL